MQMYKLKESAKSECKGKTYHHVVVLKRSKDDKVVLKIMDTPGEWYLSSLLLPPIRNRLAIDYGQGWIWVNMLAVLEEAMLALADGKI